MLSRINRFPLFDKRDQKLAHESTMQTYCYLQSTTNPLNPRLEQFFRGNSEHIPYFIFFSHRSSLKSFIQLCEEHCATVRHIRKILAPFSFSRVQLFSPLFHFFFIPFSFRFILSAFNKSNFRCVFTKTVILLGLAEYEMIITNSTLRASLVIYHLIFGAPS